MRRTLYLLVMLCVGLPLMSQQISNSVVSEKLSRTKRPDNNRTTPVHVSAATILYSEDFAAGLPAGWMVTDNAGNGEVWTYTTTGSVNGGMLDTVGTTAENGYMMFDSDGGGGGPAENCDLISSAISCTGQTQIYLSFNQWYWEFVTDTAYVGVSTDGVNWTYIYCPDTTLDNFEQGPNPEHKTFDISSIAANQATVYLKFHYEGNFDWWWFIDDIKVYVPDAIDVVALSVDPIASAGYSEVPVSQVAYVTLSAKVANYGGAPMSGATAFIDVIDNNSSAVVFTTGAAVPTLTPLMSTTITGQFPFYTSVVGDYRTAVRIMAAGDADTTNNSNASNIVIALSDSVFARDLGVYAGWVANGAGIGGIMGTNFTLNNSDVLTSVSIFLDSTMTNKVNPSGTPIWLTIHDQNTTLEPTTTPIASTDTLIAMPGFIVSNGQGGQWFTFAISGGPLWLNAGTYMIGVNELDSAVYVGTSGGLYTPGTNWVTWPTIPSPPANNGWATIEAFVPPLALMLRANFGPVVNSVGDENASSFGMYPNPTSDNVTLAFKSNSSKTITVYNALGEAIITSVCNSMQANLDFSGLTAGVYLVSVNDGTTTGVQQITIAR